MRKPTISTVLFLGLSLSACGDSAPPPQAPKPAAPAGEKADTPAAPAPAPKPATPAAATPAAAAPAAAAPAAATPAAASPAAAAKPGTPAAPAAAVPGAATAAKPGAPGAATPATPAKPGAAPAKSDKPLTSKEKLLAELHIRPFKPEEMVANPPIVTDPFHNNLPSFAEKPPQDVETCPLAKYNLEELKLTAILQGTGDTGGLSKAMFIDPTGKGYFLKRSDRVAKGCPVVQRVLSDRVIFQYTEEVGPGTTRQVERVIELYPGGEPLPVP